MLKKLMSGIVIGSMVLSMVGSNAAPTYETYIDCWLTAYGKTISSSTITVTETATISYSDII